MTFGVPSSLKPTPWSQNFDYVKESHPFSSAPRMFMEIISLFNQPSSTIFSISSVGYPIRILRMSVLVKADIKLTVNLSRF